ncbi:isoleucyl-tRNA synthetase [Litorimonas taeanensis]|uniref:Isoleucine--tRNA ligase n=1 Tax=Litorimonas taeanensis TaxID=568099 RepID=A0A420WIC9_9PROT|nr:isoleucine--tRNA ligase [Litorimonas taeanensis]RKQ70743.1 isoleucyl-tRNA synthetase [Litorimonas taeanensis]
MTDSTETSRDYRETLFLPKTDFPMRANLPKREPDWIAHWNAINLYQKQRAAENAKGPWTLHDGPPYANGHIHMGTALNKILKDIINRSHQMLGHDANYVPGWDCHGLPIEWKVEEEFRGKGRQKDDVPGAEFRARCREYAAQWLDTQREEFKRLGVIGDWDNPYKTMNFQSEADICGELLKIAATGQLYRGSKPIMWSPVEQTALAEAEVEYQDKRATQIYVKFPVRAGLEDASVVIWTTTPWTIPANRAVSFSSVIKYGLYEVTEMEESEFEPWSKPGDKLIAADDLWPAVAKAGLIKSANRLQDVDASTLVLDHPLKDMEGADGKYDFPVPLLEGSHVTADAGTGFVHTAPSHGEDDYVVWISNQTKLEGLGIDPIVPMTLDNAGCYTDVMPTRFQGLDVIRTSGKKRGQDGKANGEVLKALVECGNLLARGIMMLRDAHSWRSKAPVIRRATPQWFISMSKDGLREKALKAIDETKFWPDRGRNRIGTMVADRPDWLISRQRNWGVPITLIVGPNGELHTERDDADAINARILAKVEEIGVDGWFDTPLEHFMPEDNAGWEKVTDILDVWFDSGSTHAFCLKRREDLPDRADLYLEGSDQHRGWFQSSLMESCAIYGEAPYKGVLTHGFVVDEKGLKMSKSLGNTMSPEDISKQFGAEIMRIWTASSDWANDLKIGKEIIQTSADAYRKLRNTLRYMIGALDGFDASETVDYADMPALEKWVLHRLSEITDAHEGLVRDHDHKRIFSTLFNFCTVDLSAFYFDIRKDALYCDPLDSTRRRACRTVMNEIFLRLTTWLAPIMSFTMEEVWQARFPSDDSSVHLELFRSCPDEWENRALAAQVESIRDFRTATQEAIEPSRKEGIIRSSLEASVTGPSNPELLKALSALNISRQEVYANPADPQDTLADYLIISDVTLSEKAESFTVEDLKGKSLYRKCERSWKYFQGDGDITPRDKAAVMAFDN